MDAFAAFVTASSARGCTVSEPQAIQRPDGILTDVGWALLGDDVQSAFMVELTCPWAGGRTDTCLAFGVGTTPFRALRDAQEQLRAVGAF